MAKIIIAVPCAHTITAKTTFSLVQTALFTKGQDLDILIEMSCDIVLNRIRLVQRALAENADYIFFVDSDMFFDPSALTKLLLADKDIIALPANRRKLPLESNVRALDPAAKVMPFVPHKVASVGTAVMLIKAEVFKKIPSPYFKFEYAEDGGKRMGEDVYFCHKAREAGFDIWVDPTIHVKHIGDYEF